MIAPIELLRRALAVGPLAFAWLWTWAHLSRDWHDQYAYGWGVPALFLLLVWRRWSGSSGSAPLVLPLMLEVLGSLIWGLGELIRQHDPIWGIAGALLMLGCSCFSAAWILRLGGWPLLKRLAYPLLFAWSALPWRASIETVLTQNLLQWVIQITVLAATVAGVPAFQNGNVIELNTGALGVDDACSGIESLQAALMAGLFLGDWYRLTPGRRLALLGACALLAFVGNVLRVGTLMAIAVNYGIARELRFHDLTGGVATLGVFLGILRCATHLCACRAGTDLPSRQPLRTPSVWAGAGLALSLSAIVLGGRWLAGGSSGSQSHTVLRLDLSSLPAGWTVRNLQPTKKELAMLGCSSWEAWKIHTGLEVPASLYLFSWDAANGAPPVAFQHTPAVCLPSLGWTEFAAAQNVHLPGEADSLPCVNYNFAQGSSRLAVFQIAVVSGKACDLRNFSSGISGRMERLKTLWKTPGQRLEQEMLLYLPWSDDARDAPLKTAQALLTAILKSRELEPVVE